MAIQIDDQTVAQVNGQTNKIFGIPAIQNAMTESLETYGKLDKNGKPTLEVSWLPKPV